MTEAIEREPDMDKPTVFAHLIVNGTRLVTKVGFSYLTMRRRAHKSARVMESAMKANGLPDDLAHRLSVRYEEDSRLVHSFMRDAMNKRRLW